MAVIQMSAYDKGRTNVKPAYMSCYCKDQRTLSESKEEVRAVNVLPDNWSGRVTFFVIIDRRGAV